MGIESEDTQRVRGTDSKGTESWGFTDMEGSRQEEGSRRVTEAQTWKQME